MSIPAVLWKPWQKGSPAPNGAISGGKDTDGSEIFIARGQVSGDSVPGKAIPSKNVLYVAYNGNEVALEAGEVLCQPFLKWVSTSGNSIPEGSFQAGTTSDGENLYIGRVKIVEFYSIGKVHPSHGTCYVPFGGKEEAHKDYEILAITAD